jgi:membrane protein YqaA with SNARE-associated domain
LAGAGAGLYLGNRLLRGNRFTAGEGLLVSAGHLAGGATALGITYLLVEEIDDHPLLYLATSTVGSLLGAGLTYRALGEGSADPPGVGLRRGAARRLAVRGATLELHPESLLLAWRPGERAIPFATIRF